MVQADIATSCQDDRLWGKGILFVRMMWMLSLSAHFDGDHVAGRQRHNISGDQLRNRDLSALAIAGTVALTEIMFFSFAAVRSALACRMSFRATPSTIINAIAPSPRIAGCERDCRQQRHEPHGSRIYRVPARLGQWMVQRAHAPRRSPPSAYLGRIS